MTIGELELAVLRQARIHDPNALALLTSVPGIGKMLALTILYEIHDISRFPLTPGGLIGVRRRAHDRDNLSRVPAIVEEYRDFLPPCNAAATVEDLLASVPPRYLCELKAVLLTNSTAMTGSRRRAWSWHRGRKARHTAVLGLYHHATPNASDGAWIELFVDRIVAAVPTWALRLALARATLFGSVLFHELGHHIHATVRPEHKEREDVADNWGRRLLTAHLRRRHSVTWALSRPAVWLSPLVRSYRRRRARAA